MPGPRSASYSGGTTSQISGWASSTACGASSRSLVKSLRPQTPITIGASARTSSLMADKTSQVLPVKLSPSSKRLRPSCMSKIFVSECKTFGTQTSTRCLSNSKRCRVPPASRFSRILRSRFAINSGKVKAIAVTPEARKYSHTRFMPSLLASTSMKTTTASATTSRSIDNTQSTIVPNQAPK